SAPMVESDRLVAECHRRGITCERLMGCRDLMFEGRASTPRTQPSPLPIPDDAYELTDVTMAAAPAAPRGPAAAQSADETKAQALTEFLKRLTRLDVRLRLKDGELRVSAPKGALDAELTASLRAFKPQIVNLLEGAPSRSASASAPASGPSSSPDAPWREDLKLALEIQPVRTTGKKLDQASHILLTGATGFLGPYVLFELLQQTTARISCLVRGNSVADAGSRLRDALRAFDLWRDEYASRIEPIVGDLGKPLLGMPRSTFDALADRVDTIFHNGAQVHHAMPYEQLRQVNVLGTQEVLRLAAAGEEAIPVHYVSTLSVLPAAALADRARFFEHDLIAEYPPPAGGYNLSKWVAENLLVEARQRGAAVTVYRPGPVSGDSRSGAYNENDFLFRLMSGYVESGLAPDGATLIDVLPVDFVARAIVTLARSTATSHATFHLLHPQPVSSELLFDVCRDAGVPIRRVPYDQWFEHLKTIARDASDHALFPLVALFSSRRGREMAAATPTELPFDTSAADAALATVELAPPALDRELFRTYLRALLGTFVGDTARSDEPAADAGASR
ncbi:MAG: thioester reductase domain-containing protein, partial [Pseudomonadota bacterium]